jgi:hypothetical protein
MNKTRNAINKRTVLYLLLLVVALYSAWIYIRYRSLHDDDLMMELIKNHERVEFEHIQLSRVSPSPKLKNVFGSGSTLYIRYFTAWKYHPDEVSKADNYKKHGWVDMRHRVHVSIALKGTEGFI